MAVSKKRLVKVSVEHECLPVYIHVYTYYNSSVLFCLALSLSSSSTHDTVGGSTLKGLSTDTPWSQLSSRPSSPRAFAFKLFGYCYRALGSGFPLIIIDRIFTLSHLLSSGDGQRKKRLVLVSYYKDRQSRFEALLDLSQLTTPARRYFPRMLYLF